MANLIDEEQKPIIYRMIDGNLSTLLSRKATFVKKLIIQLSDKGACKKEVRKVIKELRKIFSHFCHLEYLQLCGCGGVIKDTLLQIIGENLQQLRHLAIPVNTRITDVGLGFLTGAGIEGVGCPLMEEIHIERAAGITALGVTRVTSNFKNLQTLSLYLNVSDIDNQICQSLVSSESLKDISLRSSGATAITGLTVLKDAGFKQVFFCRIGGNTYDLKGCWIRND